VRPLDLAGDGFYRLLDATEHVRRVADPGATPCRPLVRPASSACVDTAPVASLLCVGDAASAHDPLAGDGIVQGLRSGIFAAYAVADWLRQGDPRGLSRYRLLLRREFAAYAETLADYYRLEQRWPGSPFWQRRHDRPTAGSRVPAMTDADAGGWRGAAPA
jgi:2-polyprenyl-6-methoxyphenol hydroxylase-like FAD-dependent oxidoreductase